MNGDLNQLIETMMPTLVTYGINIVAALAILIFGLWLAGRIANMINRAMDRTGRVDRTLSLFLSSLVKYIVIVVTVLAVLAQFGVEITSLLVVFGSAGLAIGLALQGTLSNVAAGVMLLLFRPFKVGDFVEVGGQSGSVKAVGLFVTELATGDNVQIIMPNGQVWGASLKNYSYHPTRRVDLVMGVSYDDDIDKAIGIIKEVVEADERSHKDPEPLYVVGNLGDSSVDITVRVWCASGDYWPLKFDLTKKIKEAFDAGGISIPFPSRTVYAVGDSDD